MDILLQKATAKRDALAAELAKLDNFIRTAKELMADPSTLGRASGKSAAVPVPPTNGGAYVPNKTIVLNACRELIAQRKAVPLKALLSDLNAKGINPGTNSPSIALSVMLSRSDDFKSDRKKGGWTLAKVAPQVEQTPRRAA